MSTKLNNINEVLKKINCVEDILEVKGLDKFILKSDEIDFVIDVKKDDLKIH